MRISFFFSLFISIFGFSVIAQEIEHIEVQATRQSLPLNRLSSSVSLLDDYQQQTNGQDIVSTLNQLPGVWLQNSTNAAQDPRISIRGFGAKSSFGIRGVQVLLDGIPLTLADGQTQLDSLDLFALDRVEVLRGSSSARYGNAAGGVIHLFSRPLLSEVVVNQEVSSHQQYRHRFYGATGNNEKGASLSILHTESEGYRDHNRTRQSLVNARVHWALSEHTQTQWHAHFFDAPLEQDPGAVTLEQFLNQPKQARARNQQFDAQEQIEQYQLSASILHQLAPEQRLQFTGFALSRQFDNKLPFANAGQVDLNRDYYGLSALYEFEHQGQWQLGIDYRDQNDIRQRFNHEAGERQALVFAQQEQVHSYALFAQWYYPVNKQTTLQVGSRWDRVDLDVHDRFLGDGDDSGHRVWQDLSGFIGVNHHWTETLISYANISTSFQTPTTTELANPEQLGQAGGFNAALEPEQSVSVEFGFKQQVNPQFFYDLALFHIKLRDELTTAALEIDDDRDFFENSGRSSRYGLEWSSLWQISSQWDIRSTYQYSQFSFDRFISNNNDFSGQQLPGIPKHQGNIRTNYQLNEAWNINLRLFYRGQLFANNSNEVAVGGYTRVDLGLSYQQRYPYFTTHWFAQINNLTDKLYPDTIRVNAFGGRFYEAAPERQFRLGFSLHF